LILLFGLLLTAAHFFITFIEYLQFSRTITVGIEGRIRLEADAFILAVNGVADSFAIALLGCIEALN
jgi:hypothetical protein